ncbi:unnamed protein product [Rhizophagus irregularis]|nr:unnamed protein product [Rhizophagus irregularis]
MENFVPECTFEYTVSNVGNLSSEVYTPNFATTAELYWQLEFAQTTIKSIRTYSVYLWAIENPEEQYTETLWPCRNKLMVKLYLKDPKTQKLIKSQVYLKLGLSKKYPGIGTDEFYSVSASRFPDDIIIGVQFSKNEVSPVIQVDPFPEGNIPDDLVEAWSAQLDKTESADVRFDVQDKTIYASSTILSKRSEYFQKFFQGGWAESQVENSLSNQPILESESLPNISYHIKITDFDATTFYEMLRFLYTNQLRFNHLAKHKISPLQVFCIADKYLLTELRQKAKCEVLRDLNINNVAEGLFTIAYKWPELKDPFLKFFIENVSSVRQTSGFDAILTNPTDYPGFKELFKEILTAITTDI